MTGELLFRPYHLPLRRGVAGARGTTVALVGTAVGLVREGRAAWACAPRLAAWPHWQPTIDAFARDLANCAWHADQRGVGLATWLSDRFALKVRENVPLALTADLAALLDGSLARQVHGSGVVAVKVKVAADVDPAALAAAIAALRARCGRVSVRLDANGTWSHLAPAALLERLRRLRGAGVDSVEDPVPWQQWPAESPLALALDLLDADVATLRTLAGQGRLGLAVVKPALCGSVEAFLALAADLAVAKVPLAVSSCFDAPLGLRQLAALAAVAPGDVQPSGLCTHLDLSPSWRSPELAPRKGRWQLAMIDTPALSAPAPWHDLLGQAAARAPLARALTWVAEGQLRGWSWRQLDRHASRIARGLSRARLPVGSVVSLWCGNSPELVAVLWGIWRAGLVAAPAHPRWTAAEFARWYGQVGAVLGAVDADHDWAGAVGLDQLFSGYAALSSTDAAPMVQAHPVASSAGACAQAAGQLRALVATSGTTGSPKVVALSEVQLAAAAFSWWQRHSPQPDDRWLLPLPICHVAGLVGLWRCAAATVEAVVAVTTDSEGIVKALRRRPTLASLVPTQLHRLVAAGVPPGNLRLVLVGGASAAPELLSAARCAGWPAIPSYGMTETTAAAAVGDAADKPAQTGPYRLVGRPLPGLEFAIGQADEILVRGEAVGAAPGDWLSTGDTGRIDGDGRLWVASRRSDRVVRGGENVDPFEVEATLRCVAAVEDVAVVGIADAELGECVAAWVVSAADVRELQNSLTTTVASLAPFKRPQRWHFTATPLPRNAMGKLDANAVRRAFVVVESDACAT